MHGGFRYEHDERLPVEVLVFDVGIDHLDDFLRVDHEIWTLGEAEILIDGRIPFLSKEVWLDDSTPGRVTIVFVWESIDAWNRVGADEIQRRLQHRFDESFDHPVELVAAPHEDADHGIHRWSRFERIEPRER